MLACQASLLTTSHIPGITNTMADFASHSFTDFPNKQAFLTEFHNHFPSPWQVSWISCTLLTTTVGCVLSMMSAPTSRLVLWWKLKLHTTITGGIEPNSFQQTSTHIFRTWRNHKNLWSFKILFKGCRKESLVMETKSKLEASRQPLGPLARQLSLLGYPTHYIDWAPPTTMPPLPSK